MVEDNNDKYAQAIGSGETIMYCTNGMHNYHVELEGHAFPTDHFVVNNETKTILIPLTLCVESNHQINYELSGAGENGHTEANAAAVTTAPVTTEPPSVTMGTIPQIWADYKDNNAVQLGENVFGHSYNGGYIWIHGSGPMYDFARTPFDSAAISNVTHVVIENLDAENGIQNIGANVFKGATNLETVYLPQTVTTIGDGAFSGCESLKWLRYGGEEDTSETFVLPNRLSVIGVEAFRGCKSAAFGAFTLPKSIQSIGENAFEGCEGITELTIPGDSGVEIGRYAFNGCSNIQKAILCEGINLISDSIFFNCTGMEDLTLPYCGFTANIDNTDTYDYDNSCFLYKLFNPMVYAFNVSDGLYKVHEHYDGMAYHTGYVPKKLTKVTVTGGTIIPPAFFRDMTELVEISISNNITMIKPYAFQNCTSLRIVSIPEELTEIKGSAFIGCKSVEFGALTLPKSIKIIGESAFQGCEGITELTIPGDSGVEIGRHAFNGCINIRKAVLCEGISQISDSLFFNCTGMEELTLPYCGYNTESSCLLFQLFNPSISASYCNDLYEVYNHDYYGYVPKKLTKVIVIGGTVIPSAFFQNMTELKEVSCLSSISLIAETAFENCTNLMTVSLPLSLTEVKSNAFNNCNSLTQASLVGENADWHNVVISKPGNEPLENCQYTRPVKTLAAPALRTLWNGLHVQWTTVPNADGYRVQYCQDPSFTGETLHASDHAKDKTVCSLTKYPKAGETWYVRVRAFVSSDGSETGTQTGIYSDAECITIPAAISSVELSKTVFPYTGKAVKVGNYISVKSGDTKLKYETDFIMTYSNNVHAGYQTASVTVTGVGNYTGTITKYYTIAPAQQAKPVLSALSNGIRVQWTADPNADGYRVQYCQDPSFTGETLHTWNHPKNKTECSLTKYPKAGETWYVRVRAFVSSDGAETGTQAGFYSDAECIRL